MIDWESPSDLKHPAIERHIEMISRFVERVTEASEKQPYVTMILRTPESGPALALMRTKETLLRARVNARVILARIEPEDALRQLYACIREFAPGRPAHELLRWARNPRLLDAHEQVTFGETMCWTGDAMRREADKRNALTLFSEAAPDAIRLGRQAFEALWLASMPVPRAQLQGRSRTAPIGAYEPSAETSLALSTLRRGFQVWPLIRH